MYEALRVFLTLSVIPLLGGLFLLGRFTYYFLIGDGQGHIQSMIVATILIVLGFLTILIGLLSDLIARNRTLGEDANYRLKKMDIR